MTVETTELVPESPYIWRARRPGHRHRLICFPYAGAGASAYADWAALLPPTIELVAVQLPGRQNRIAEEPFTETGPLINVLTHALRPVMDGQFSFFGHSCGAMLAFELARALRARGHRGPERLFLSAQPAPGTTGIKQLHDLPDEEFRTEILRLGGVDPEIAADEHVMRSLLTTLRADFRLWERHHPAPEPSLDCPIIALAGGDDPRASMESVLGWQKQTTAGFTARFYPGGHFFFLESPATVVSLISDSIQVPALSGTVA